MMVIGLTGGIASGKSTVAAMLRHAHIPVIDADLLARQAVAPGSHALTKIVETFGKDVLNKDDTLNRSKLGDLVFSSEELLRKLEEIIHPKIKELYAAEINNLKKDGHHIAVYMAPLLYEKELHRQLDKTILVVANDALRRRRIFTRDRLSENEISQRINAQLNDKIKSSLADEIIKNNGTMDDLYNNLCTSWQKITGMKLPRSYHD